MIDPAVFRQHSVVGGLMVATLFFAGTAYTLVLTVHLQTGTGFSPLHTALTLIPFTVGVGVGSALAPRMVVLGRNVALVGSLVIAGAHRTTLSTVLGTIAVTASTINVVGGFLITDRMLRMFRRRDERKAPKA
jgi:hypothetical protein